jgi:hypothetical protein
MTYVEYRLKTANVMAEKVEEDTRTVVTINGVRTAYKGDYVVELSGTKQVRNDESGEFETVVYSRGHDIVSAEEFEAAYSPIRKRKVPGDDEIEWHREIDRYNDSVQ